MPGEPAQPLTPAWVALAPRLAPDPGQAWLRPGDAAHARMLRHLGARALHEPLLAALPVASPELHANAEDAGASMSLVQSAGRALRALLPGHPKPVAALTRSPEVTERLLRVLAAGAATPTEQRGALAAQVLFSLALTQALTEPVTLVGPLTLEHSVTRRGLALCAGHSLTLSGEGLLLEGQPLDPWGAELGASVVEHYGFTVPRRAQPELGALGEALRVIAARDACTESLAEMFVALELAPSAVPSSPSDTLTLPLAIGRARLPGGADPPTLAHALLRESALHKLTLLRLVDPLVYDELALPGLLHAVDEWVGRRLALSDAPRAASSLAEYMPAALTPLGQRVLAELAELR